MEMFRHRTGKNKLYLKREIVKSQLRRISKYKNMLVKPLEPTIKSCEIQ